MDAPLFVDTETRGPDLNKIGLANYAAHPQTGLLLFPYAIGDEPARLWDVYHQPTRPPLDLVQALNSERRLVAHHAVFDRVILKWKAGFHAPVERWYCTEARANIHGLPGSLDKLSQIFGLGADAKKAKRGKELIKLFCTPPYADPDTHVVEWLEFCEYAIYDVIAMRELYKRMPDWCFTPFEQRVYHVNEKINDRGFHVDIELAERMIEASEWAQARLNERVAQVTQGAIQKASQATKLGEWFGATLTDMRAETLRTALRDEKSGRVELTDAQRELIELRLLGSKSSTSKCRTAIQLAGADDRIRYATKYAGGGRIARFSHKGFQPGNMPRPDRKYKKHIPDAIEALKGDYLTDVWGDESMAVCSSCIRGIITAEEGNTLIAADWSNIEGRMLAWYANEEWKLQVYHDADAGIGEDGYKILGNRMTGISIDQIDDFIRQQFKGCDLSMGYEGGVGAWLNIANSYQIDLVETAATVPKNLGPAYMERGERDWQRAGEEKNKFGLPREIYVGVAALKHAYRDACPNIKALWWELLDTAKKAVKYPGKQFSAASSRVWMMADADWLAVQIPSGRKIMFAKPRIRMEQVFEDDGDEKIPVLRKDGTPVYRETLSACKSPTWHRAGIYGGLIANAITQGGCRDILASALVRVDAAGYPIILDIHDEIICEVPIGGPYTLEGLIELMLHREPWFDGMPLAANGFTDVRYKKE